MESKCVGRNVAISSLMTAVERKRLISSSPYRHVRTDPEPLPRGQPKLSIPTQSVTLDEIGSDPVANHN